MDTIFARLQYSVAKFWEATDRGHVNLYYTPYQYDIDYFQKIQVNFKHESQKKIPA